MGTVRHLVWKLRGPLIGWAAALVALALGADFFFSTCIFLFVGLFAWMGGIRSDIADVTEESDGRSNIGGWLAGGDMGGGGGFGG
jgi:hypothetical protein